MSNTKLIYITHPSVSIDPSIAIEDWELSAAGLLAVESLLALDFWPTVSHIYSSQEKKAYTVAELAATRLGTRNIRMKELGEADRSSTGLISPVEEYMKVVMDAYDNLALGVRGWESHLDMLVRNAKVIDKLKQEHQGKTIAIVGHGGAGTTVKCYIKGILPNFAEDPKQTGCYFIADLTEKKILTDWTKY